MRRFVLTLLAWVAPSLLSSQEPAPRPVLVDDVPEGTNWVANGRTHLYYRVGCPITASIPATDKLYYKNETSLQAAGFTKSEECDMGDPTGVAPPTPTQQRDKAKEKQRRTGFWFNGGLGYGSLGCEDCDGREGAVTGSLALGGTVSQKVLLGTAMTGWAKSENGAELDVGTLVAVIRFYTSASGGFFLLGGLGLSSIHTEISGLRSETETGAGALVGLGYDLRVGDNISLTPFWNGFGANTDHADANVTQIGLGVTIH